MSNAEPGNAPVPADIVAPPDGFFRLKRLLIVLMVVGVGAWFCYDGFYNWPLQKRQAVADVAAQRIPKEKPHSDTDIYWNQFLGIALPPLGLVALAWFWYESRGQYRLSGQTLHVPGHPPIPLDSITLIDKSKWERKGVATLKYDSGDGRERTFKLDNFIYSLEPTDLIFHRIEARFAVADPGAEAPPAALPTEQ